jgi:hypothetical protein
MSLQILSFYPLDGDEAHLHATPNVNESEYIREFLAKDETPTITNLNNGPLTIITHHRGSNLYCAGRVTVYRLSPITFGGNGYYTMPSPGTEETVEFSTAGGRFRGQVIFL